MPDADAVVITVLIAELVEPGATNWNSQHRAGAWGECGMVQIRTR